MKKVWKLSELQSTPLAPAFRPARGWHKERRWAMQAMIALGLFLVVVGAFSFNYPLAGSVQRSLRYYLGAAESDWTPQLRTMVEAGLWQDTVDRQAANLQPAQEAWSSAAPLSIPVSGRVSREFGWVSSPVDGSRQLHGGIDIQANPGTPVRAALAGRVKQVGQVAGQGRLVEVEHGQGMSTVYLRLDEVLVEKGQDVREGEVVGKLGSKDPYLHFEVRHNGEPVNPLPSLSQGSKQKI